MEGRRARAGPGAAARRPVGTLLVAFAALRSAGAALAQGQPVPPPPGTEQDISRPSASDASSDAASADELVRDGVALTAESGIRGWITVPQSDGLVVGRVMSGASTASSSQPTSNT